MADPAIVLVIVAATSSAMYKSLCGQPFSKRTLQTAMKVHAYTIEIVQLLVVLTTTIDLYHTFYPRIDDDGSARVLSTLAFGSICLFAIDVIDNFIQLQRFTHPVQSQTLLLTRRWLVPGTVRVLKSPKKTVKFTNITPPMPILLSKDEVKRRSRLRRMSEPVTPTRVGLEVPRRHSFLSPVVEEASTPRFTFGPFPSMDDGIDATGPALPTPTSPAHIRQAASDPWGADQKQNAELDYTVDNRTELPPTPGTDSTQEEGAIEMPIYDLADEVQMKIHHIRACLEFSLSRDYDSDSSAASDGSLGRYVHRISDAAQETDRVSRERLEEVQARFAVESGEMAREVRALFGAQLEELERDFRC